VKKEVEWITDALSSKNLAREMTHYRVQGGEIRATDGRITAGHPFPDVGNFLVPGREFEKLLKRFPTEPTVEILEQSIKLKSGRSHGTIQTLNLEQWNYPGVDADIWEDAPEGLVPVLRKLKPFVSDNATQEWALGIALEYGYAYATNNIVIAGARIDSIGDERIGTLPVWAIEFLLDREEDLTDWAWTENYVAFRWASGAWMRSQLINTQFNEQASAMARNAEQYTPRVEITKEFRESFMRSIDLCEGAVGISATELSGAFGQAQFADEIELEDLPEKTFWAAKMLKPVIAEATHWEPHTWPKAAPFRGEHLFGYILGRRE
jgi:hypothetical protein